MTARSAGGATHDVGLGNLVIVTALVLWVAALERLILATLSCESNAVLSWR